MRIHNTVSVSVLAFAIWSGTILPATAQVSARSNADGVPHAEHAPDLTRAQTRILQQMLADLGYNVGKPDGLFGARTADAIRNFEIDHGIVPTGQMTASTFALVEAAAQGATGAPLQQDSSPEQPLRNQAQGDIGGLACADLMANASFVAPSSILLFDAEHHVQQADAGDALGNDVNTVMKHFYSNGPDDIIVHLDQPAEISAGAGDDRIFVFGAPLGTYVAGEGGSDTIHICSLSAPLNMLSPNDGEVTIDSDRDTIVIHPLAFAAAAEMGESETNWMGTRRQISGAEILIMGFDARTDRIILRSVEAITPRVASRQFPVTTIAAGPISLGIVSLDPAAPDPLEAIIVERVSADDLERDERFAADLPKLAPETPSHADNHEIEDSAEPISENLPLADDPVRVSYDATCETTARYAQFDEPEPADTSASYHSRETTWTDRDDIILHRGTGEQHVLRAAGGDDQIWIHDMSSDTQISAGRGADLVILCSMQDISGSISLGPGEAEIDDDPDTLIIGPDVLLNIPEGFSRQLMVMEFQPETDVLVLPPVDDASGIKIDATGFNSVVTYGRLRLNLGHANMQSADSVRASIRVGTLPAGPHIEDIRSRKPVRAQASPLPVIAESWANAVTLAGTPAFGEVPLQTCADAETVQRSTPLDQRDYGGHSAIRFGDADDIIVLRSIASDPQKGVRTESVVATGAGNDLVYMMTANASISPGPGSDTIIVCALDALSASFESPTDGAPDTIVMDSSALLSSVTEGLFRRFSFTGFGDPEDRLIIRVPEDYEYKRMGHGVELITRGSLSKFSFGPHPLEGLQGKTLGPEQIIIWPMAEVL